MSSIYKISFFILTIIILLFSSFYIKDFRIDASSDTLVAQNDIDFKFFNYYQQIFPTKNSLVVAIKSKKEIDKNLLNEIDNLSLKITKLDKVSSVFNINKAPILFLNKTSLIDLSKGNYETILNTTFEVENVLDEFNQSPIYKNQIINDTKNTTALIIFLNPNKKLEDLRENKNLYIKENTYYKKKTEIDKDRSKLIEEIRKILIQADNNYEYYLGGVEMISNDVISFVKSDIIVFSLLVVLLVLIILFLIFKKIKWV